MTHLVISARLLPLREDKTIEKVVCIAGLSYGQVGPQQQSLQCYINPEARIPNWREHEPCLTNVHLSAQPPLPRVWEHFCNSLLPSAPLDSQRACLLGFDIENWGNRLREEVNAINARDIFQEGHIVADVKKMAQVVFPHETELSLEKLATLLNIKNTPYEWESFSTRTCAWTPIEEVYFIRNAYHALQQAVALNCSVETLDEFFQGDKEAVRTYWKQQFWDIFPELATLRLPCRLLSITPKFVKHHRNDQPEMTIDLRGEAYLRNTEEPVTVQIHFSFQDHGQWTRNQHHYTRLINSGNLIVVESDAGHAVVDSGFYFDHPTLTPMGFNSKDALDRISFF